MPIPTTYRIPAHKSGDCRKALYLYAAGVAPSNPPDGPAINRMETGQAMKPATAAALRREGWQIRPVPTMPDIPVTDTLRIGVVRDLVMSHDEITAGQWIAGVSMSTGERNVSDWLVATTAGAYPRQLRRLSLMGRSIAAAP